MLEIGRRAAGPDAAGRKTPAAAVHPPLVAHPVDRSGFPLPPGEDRYPPAASPSPNPY